MGKLKFLIIIILLYFYLCYTDNFIIAKYRTLYIETALSTMNHQWLATKLLPNNVVEPVLNNSKHKIEDGIVDINTVPPMSSPDYNNFITLFNEIDIKTLPSNFDYESFQLSDIADLNIKTIYGDDVWAIDISNNIIIIDLERNQYRGKLAIIKDPSRVYLATGDNQTVTDMCVSNECVLGINAGGFVEQAGAIGCVISEGIVYNSLLADESYQYVGFDTDNNLLVGSDLDVSKLRDAVQFYPILVLNGHKVVDGSHGLGIHPRTVIGQAYDKSVMFLVIDGRQIGYSIGATLSECADILIDYGAWTAVNMDGGNSSSMTYMGKMITRTSSHLDEGRIVPNAWVVRY